MRIKPILNLGKSGKIETFEKVKTHTRAIQRLYDLIVEYGKDYKECIYIVLHTGRLADAKVMCEELSTRVTNAKRIELTTITPTVGAHIGCGILGLAVLPLDGLKEQL